MSALVSVIVPTHNRAQVVVRAMNSVLEQTWRPIELIVINDGSTDDTAQVLESARTRVIAAGVEPLFITKPNGGAASARNAGLRAARGEYIAFLDDDDLWRPHKLERQLAAMRECGADACCCFVSRHGGRHKRSPATDDALLRGRDAARFLSRGAYAHITSIVFKAALCPVVGEFDESLRVYEDEEWKARLVHEASFAAVPEELATYTFSEQALTRFTGTEAAQRRDHDFMRHLNLIRERCHSRAGWSEQAWKERAAHVYDECAKHLLYRGDLKGARALYEQGISLCGPIMALPKLRSKLRKAWWLSWLGLRPRHPKLKTGQERG
ncbi:glycosyltransferase family 2 protein [bacterium]|nr:MAG: glycosyltransferase family 2 protein [bacterium]RIK62443.1 MAG: hypothetical protein DCC64_10190 [Planctomycetota bacterium]